MGCYVSLEDKVLSVLESDPERWWTPNEIIYEATADGGMASSVRCYLSRWQRSILDKLEYKAGKHRYVFYRLKEEKDSQCIQADDEYIRECLENGQIYLPAVLFSRFEQMI